MFIVYFVLMLFYCFHSLESASAASLVHAKGMPAVSVNTLKAAKMRNEIAKIFTIMSFEQSTPKEQSLEMANVLRDIVRYCTLLLLEEYPLMPLNDLIDHVTEYIPAMIDNVTPEKKALYASAYTQVQIPLVVEFAQRLNPSAAEKVIKRVRPLVDKVQGNILVTDVPRYKFIISNIPINDTQDAIQRFLHGKFQTNRLDFKIISHNDKTLTQTIVVTFYDDNKALQKIVQDYEKQKQSKPSHPFVLVSNDTQNEWSPSRRAIILEKIVNPADVSIFVPQQSKVASVQKNGTSQQLPQRPIPFKTKQPESNAPVNIVSTQSIYTNTSFVKDLKREINAIIALQDEQEDEDEVMSVMLQYLILHEHKKRPLMTYVDLFDEITQTIFAGDQTGLTWLKTLKPDVLDTVHNISLFNQRDKELVMQNLYGTVQAYVTLSEAEYVQKKPHKSMYALLSYQNPS